MALSTSHIFPTLALLIILVALLALLFLPLQVFGWDRPTILDYVLN